MKMRPRSDDTCQLDMYTLQSFHTPNILDLLLIVLKTGPKIKNLHTQLDLAYQRTPIIQFLMKSNKV